MISPDEFYILFCFSTNAVFLSFFSYSHICILKALCHEYIAVLRQFWVEVITYSLDCKTVRIFAYSSTREQSNKRSGTRLKTESETHTPVGRVRLARFARVRLLRHALPISLLILKKKNRLFCSLLTAFSHSQNAPLEIWERYQTNFIREHQS